VTVVSKLKAVAGFVPVTFLFRFVFDQNTQSLCDPQLFLQVSGVQFVSEGDEIAEGIDGFFTQSEVGRASTIKVVDLV